MATPNGLLSEMVAVISAWCSAHMAVNVIAARGSSERNSKSYCPAPCGAVGRQSDRPYRTLRSSLTQRYSFNISAHQTILDWSKAEDRRLNSLSQASTTECVFGVRLR